MLQKSPDDRYPSIEAVDLELESWSFGRPVLARPITAPARLWRLARRNPLSASLVGTMILVAIATVVILSVMLDRETSLRRTAISAAAEANLASAISAHAAGDIATRDAELARITEMATHAHGLGLEVHAGHGLTYDTVGPVAGLPEIRELNIGHFLIGEAIFRGLSPAIAEMRRRMEAARRVLR